MANLGIEKKVFTLNYAVQDNQKLVEMEPCPMLIQNNLCTHGHEHRFKQSFIRVDSYKYSFFPSVIKSWNSLPVSIITSPSIDTFNKTCLIGCMVNLIFSS